MEPPPPTYRVSAAGLRTTRMRQGASIKDIAKTCGIARSYLQRLETGVRQRMSAGKYVALRTALNATDEDLLAPEDQPEKR